MTNVKKIRCVGFLFLFLILCNQAFATDSQYVLPENIKELDVGTAVKTEGTVIVKPGILGLQFFYINGVQIYCYFKDFPELKNGDKIVVQGYVSQAREEKRINIKDKKGIEILEHQSMIEPQAIEIKEIDYSLVGKLLKIQGQVIEKTGPRIFVSDGQSEITIYIKEYTKINKGIIQEGDNLEIIGILNQSNDELRLLPRSDEDINFVIIGTDEPKQANSEFLILGGLSQSRVINFNTLKTYFIFSSIFLSLVLVILIILKKSESKKNEK